MAENSKIEWTHHTANLWWGCVEVHAGCDNCYAAALSNRWGNDLWGADRPRKRIAPTFDHLAKYQRLAAKAGGIHRVFVGSMMDIFEKPMPMISGKGEPYAFDTGHVRTELFDNITAGKYPNLMFLLLTKRPSNINKYIPDSWKAAPPRNVMFGTSPVDVATYNRLVPQLLGVNGQRFLSIEPQLQGIYGPELEGIHWVIQGGESGPKRRPFDLEWARSMRDDCAEAGVPYFFKQIDKLLPIPDDLLVRQFPASHTLIDEPYYLE